MKLTDFSVDKPVTITMVVLIVVVVGVISLTKLGMDMMPDIDFPTLSIMVRYPGAQSEELETIVAKNYEASIAAVNGVKKIQTISQEDVCFILVDFIWGTNLDEAANDIRETVSWIEPYMPEDVESPIIIKFSLSTMPLAVYGVTGMEDTVAMKKMMEDVVQARLERLDGVAQASFFGGKTREVQVLLDRSAMLGSGVTPEQVQMALAYQNLNMPAGRLITDRREELLRTVGVYQSLDDIRNTAVGMSMKTMAPVKLSSIADVEWGYKDVRNIIRSDNMDAVMFMVMKEAGANPLQVRNAYRKELESVKELLPPEIEFGMLMDMGKVIAKLGVSVAQSGTIGALLAVLVMYLFLRNIRPTMTIAVVIPLSLLATCIPIYISGDTLNMMTMGGLVLGIGMLVDNAVVVIESIYRHMELGKDRKTAAKIGSGEVATAIIASTLTTVVVFLPIVFGGGLAARLARGLALTVAAALFCSLFVALTIVPMLASVFFSSAGVKKALTGGRFFLPFKERYRRVLTWAVHNRVKTVIAVAGLFFASLLLSPVIGAEFMPQSDAPIMMMKISFPVGTSIEETDEASSRVEAVVKQFPDVMTVGQMLGVDENDPTSAMSSTNPSGVHEAVSFIRLKDKKDREVQSVEELTSMIREKLPKVESMEVEFTDMGGSMGGDAAPVDIKLYGQDLGVLREWSDRIAEEVAEVDGLTDVDTTMRERKPERHIIIDRQKAAGYGLTVGQVAMAIKTATLGSVATRYREGGEEYDVRVRYKEQYRDSADAMRQILIPLPQGGTIPLGQVARLEKGTGPVRITRENQQRRVSITANLDHDTNLGDAMKDVAATLAPIRKQLPTGYTIEYGGEYEQMMEAFGQLILALMLAILLVYMVMASQFESFAHPFTIMFTMPLALIGVLWIFFLTGTPLSVASFLGVIMLAGIVVNNGIVMIDYINQLRAQGMDIIDATVEGATVRLRPVLITSLTTIFAMVPMAVSRAEGSETMSPLALTVIGGLVAASFFTLVIVPVVYIIVDNVARWGSNAWMRLFHKEELTSGDGPGPEDGPGEEPRWTEVNGASAE